MKKIYLLSVVFLLMLFSCSLFDNANSVDLDSSLSMDIPIVVNELSAISLKSAASFPFSETGYASLAEDEDLSDYLDKIKSIDINSVKVSFYGLQEGQVIESVSLTVSGVGEIANITNVTSNNTMYTPTISSSKLKQVADYLKENLEISATVSGSTNSAPMYFSVYNEFDITVTAKAL